MSAPGDDSVVTSAQRVVDEPAEQVLEEHYTDYDGPGGGGGATVATTPTIPSAFMPPADPGLVPAPNGHPLRTALAKLTAAKPFNTMRLALVDLTVDPKKPIYVGYNDTTQTYLASMGKLAAMLAAFNLREAARRAAPNSGAKSPSDLFKRLTRAWAAEIRQSYRAGQKVNNTAPLLDTVMSATQAKPGDPFDIDFSNKDNNAFFMQLVNALAHSMNDSAAVCIRALGFPYIEGALKAADLNGKNGFVINADYGNGFWDKSVNVFQNGSAQAVAKLLTLVAQDRVAGGGVQQDIFKVMANGVRGDIGPGINAALSDDERYSLIMYSKNGFLENTGPFSDSAIVKRKSAGTKLHYVAVVLSANSHDEVQSAGAALDDCVLLGNKLKVKQTATQPANPPSTP